VPDENAADTLLRRVRSFYPPSYFLLLEGRLLPPPRVDSILDKYLKTQESDGVTVSEWGTTSKASSNLQRFQMVWVKLRDTCPLDEGEPLRMESLIDLDDKKIYQRWTPECAKAYQEMLDGGQSLAADNPSLAARLDVRKRSEARMSQAEARLERELQREREKRASAPAAKSERARMGPKPVDAQSGRDEQRERNAAKSSSTSENNREKRFAAPEKKIISRYPGPAKNSLAP